LYFQMVSLEQIELFVQVRLFVLREANALPADADMSEVERQTREYYKAALADGSCEGVFVFENGKVVGSGGVSYFRVLPTCCITDGRKAYLMNIYTAPEYRHRGVATHILRMLIKSARSRGVTSISLEATGMGRPLYEKLGFVPMEPKWNCRWMPTFRVDFI